MKNRGFFCYVLRGQFSQRLLFILLLVLFQIPLFAQQIAVRGRVVNSGGTPVPGVTVMEMGTARGVITDGDGIYSISVSPGASLVFSFIGYNKEEIPVDGRTNIDVTLSESITNLDEIIVIGYGTQRKSDLTGAVASVKIDELKGRSIINVEQMLQGTVAGVNTVSSSGLPGGNVKINIRGVGTFYNTNPLYVVDGIQTRDISLINPNDIESMEVLKDASTTAIYGSSGANGVILITTKRGAEGRPAVEFNTKLGMAHRGKKIDVMNAPDYVDFVLDLKGNDVNQSFLDNISWRRVNRTDWQDELFRPAFQQEYNVAVSGGSKDARYSIGAGYVDQDGIIITHNYKRYSLRANTEFSPGKRFKIGENFTVSFSRASEAIEGQGNGNMLLCALRIPPYLPLLDPDNTGGYSRVTSARDHNDAYNPIAELRLRDNKTNSLRILGNLFGELEILKNLRYRTSIAVDLERNDVNTYTKARANAAFEFPSILDENFSYGNSYIYENVLSYANKFGMNDFLVLAGNTLSKSSGRYYSLTATDFTNDQIRIIPVGTGKINNGSVGANQSAKLGYFVRLNYSYADKYLFQANFRADASYNFAPENRWGYFPAFSLGWKLNEENFIKDNLTFVDQLKLRAGWGQSGSDLIPSYGFSSSISSFNPDYIFGSTPVTGAAIVSLWNPLMKWETSTTSNIGLDAALFKSRLQLTIDYFIKNTQDILIEYPMPSSTGIGLSGGSEGSAWRNAASVVNRGLEFTVNYTKTSTTGFTYNIGANATFLKNKVTDLGDGLPIMAGSFAGNAMTRTEKEHPIGSFYGFKMDRVYSTQAEVDADNEKARSLHGPDAMYQENAQAGDIRFVDVNNDGLITDADKTFIGSPIPKLVYGFNLGASYRGWSLSANFSGVSGNKIFDSNQYWLEGMVIPFNASVEIKNRWKKEGDISRIPRAVSPDANQNTRVSDRWIHNGDYLRLKVLSLGYQVPALLLQKLTSNTASSLRIYVAAENLLTITKYRGFDPEIGEMGDNLVQGVDWGQYPQSRLYMFGLEIKF